MKRKDDEKRRFWQPMVDHINAAWKRAARKEFNYPFTGKDMADLRHHSHNFGEWGLMALWDLYIESADDYVKKKNFDIFTFTRNLPRLLEHRSFKALRAEYETKLCGELPASIKEAMQSVGPKGLPPKPDAQAQRVKAWAKARKLLESHKTMLPGF